MILSALELSSEVALHLTARYLSAARWYPAVEGYSGYASSRHARILARVLMTATGNRRGWLGQRRGWEQYVDVPVPRFPVLIQLGDTLQIFNSDRGGYLDVTLHDHGLAPGWHFAQAHVVHQGDLTKHKRQLLAGRTWRHLDHATLAGRAARLGIRLGNATWIPVRVIGEAETVGIISDIDDSILVTDLPSPLQAARNAAFERASQRTPVPGMAAFLDMLQVEAEQGGGTKPEISVPGEPAPVIYLSTGAWSTAPVISQFLTHNEFPRGSVLLRPWVPTDSGHPSRGKDYKIAQFTRLVAMFPHIKWLLLGDNGQHDPTTFTTLAAAYPDNVGGIFIRTLSAEQHLLAHGSREPLPDNVIGRIPARIPVVYGADGYDLMEQISSRDFRQRLRDSLFA